MLAALAHCWDLHIFEDFEMSSNNILSFFYPIFHCGFQSRAINITKNLSTKQGNSSIKSAISKHKWFQIKRARTVCRIDQFCVVHHWYLHIFWDNCMNLHVGMHEGQIV